MIATTMASALPATVFSGMSCDGLRTAEPRLPAVGGDLELVDAVVRLTRRR
jgi:hypothetical protein